MYVIPPMSQREKRRNQLICRGPRCWNQKKRSYVAEPELQPVEITEVWNYNLEEEFTKIRCALDNGYGVVGLDTEFPGAPYVPDGVSLDYRARSTEDHYAVMKQNVDRTKIIQVGITLTDIHGNLPSFGDGKRVAWEFNFSDFDVETDECSKDSVALLEKQGIDFERHKKHGIRSASFVYFMGWSGLMGRSWAWLTFQGGVDLAYLMKMMLSNGALPDDRLLFSAFINRSFGPYVFDVKHMMTHCELYGGLDKVATTLNVDREAGQSHRAGSDSLLTTRVFQRIQQLYFQEAGALDTVAGKLHNFV